MENYSLVPDNINNAGAASAVHNVHMRWNVHYLTVIVRLQVNLQEN